MTYPSKARQLFDQGHACIIGVGADLPNTVEDANGLAGLLRDEARCAYPNEQVHVLTQKDATRSGIIKTLERLAESTTPESTVIIYFSGHGYQVVKPLKAYYLMPYGYDLENLSETAITGAEFTDLLREIAAQKLLVLFDCCHAGGVMELSGVEMAKAPLPPEATRMFAKGGGRIMIGSSLPDEQSYTGDPYSAFTHALMQGLCGKGAVREDGYVRAADLAMYASRMVPKLTDDLQHPMLDIDRADNFVLAYYAGGQTQPKDLPQNLQTPPKLELASEPSEAVVQYTHVEASGDGSVAVQNAQSATIQATSGTGNALGSDNTIDNSKVVQNVNQQGKFNIHFGTAHNVYIDENTNDDKD